MGVLSPSPRTCFFVVSTTEFPVIVPFEFESAPGSEARTIVEILRKFSLHINSRDAGGPSLGEWIKGLETLIALINTEKDSISCCPILTRIRVGV